MQSLRFDDSLKWTVLTILGVGLLAVTLSHPVILLAILPVALFAPLRNLLAKLSDRIVGSTESSELAEHLRLIRAWRIQLVLGMVLGILIRSSIAFALIVLISAIVIQIDSPYPYCDDYSRNIGNPTFGGPLGPCL